MKSVNAVAERLASGPPRGLGCTETLAREASGDSDTLLGLLDALEDPRAHVQARAANALKKVQERQPALLTPHAKRLLRVALQCGVLEAQWNLTIVIGALPLLSREKSLAVDLLFEELQSSSALLRTFALTALCDLAAGDRALQSRLGPILQEFVSNGTPAMRARARKLLGKLGSSF